MQEKDVGISKGDINMEEKIVKVLNVMSEYLSIAQMKKLQEVILQTFAENEAEKAEIANDKFLEMFLDAKTIEGCSERTIKYYRETVQHLLSQTETSVRKITTEEIREYLSDYQKLNNCSNVTRFKVLDENQLRIRYFMYYLKSKHFKEQLTKQITGSAQLNYGPSHLKKMIMPLIDITVQDEIISCMDKLQSIIETRQRELIELDRLMKARFVELFGDPRSNPFGFEKKRLKDTCKVITGNTPSRAIAEYYGDYIEWIKTDNIVSGILNPTQATESLSEKGMNVGRTVEKDSILMACIAGSIASIGRVCITDRTVAFNQQINAVVPEQYNILFLYVLFQMSKDYLVEDINMALKGILSKSKLEEKEFIIPPMDLQEQFSDFVKQVNKSKFDTMTFAPIYAIINLYLHTYFYQGRR